MRGKIKTARKEASKLHGATAQFVSLVDAGANMTPFTLIKSAKKGTTAMSIKKRGKAKATARKSHKNLKTKTKADEVETTTVVSVAKMVFSADLFATVEDVLSYLEEAEWEAEETSVKKNDDGDWVARDAALDDDDFDKISKVDMDEDGIEAFVGQREVEVKAEDEDDDDEEIDEALVLDTEAKTDDEEEEDGDEDEAEIEAKAAAKKTPAVKLSKREAFIARRKEAKEAERAKEQKFDSWDARFSDGNTLALTLKAGMSWDGVPPGYYEVQAAFNSVVSNILNDDGLGDTKQAALSKAAADYVEVISGLDTFFDAYVEADDELVAKSVDGDEAKEALTKWADNFGDFVSGEEAEAVVATKATIKKAGNKDEAPAIDYKQVGETVSEIVAKALEPVIAQSSKTAETVEKLSSRRQTKKANEPEDSGNAGPRTVATKDEKEELATYRQELAVKSMFG